MSNFCKDTVDHTANKKFNSLKIRLDLTEKGISNLLTLLFGNFHKYTATPSNTTLCHIYTYKYSL